MSTGHQELLRVAVDAARVGGRVVAELFGRADGVEVKSPGDYVSEADTASETAIREELARGAPGIPFLGEETGGRRGVDGWVVDPLDGTANFLHGLPVVAVSVALVEDGRPVAGVVHAPMLGLIYTASQGGGAWSGDERLRVSDRPPAESICATGFPFRAKDRLPRYLPVLAAALRGFEDLRRAGAATLDLAWTAAGVLDGFFEMGLGTWDVAAGGLLVREAGGVVTDWKGDPAAWLDSGDVLAGPPAVHAALLEIVGVPGLGDRAPGR